MLFLVCQRNRVPVGSLKLNTCSTNFQPLILQKCFFTKTENFKIIWLLSLASREVYTVFTDQLFILFQVYPDLIFYNCNTDCKQFYVIYLICMNIPLFLLFYFLRLPLATSTLRIYFVSYVIYSHAAFSFIRELLCLFCLKFSLQKPSINGHTNHR